MEISVDDLFRGLNDASLDLARSSVKNIPFVRSPEDQPPRLLLECLEKSPLAAEILAIWRASTDLRPISGHCARVLMSMLWAALRGSTDRALAAPLARQIIKENHRGLSKMLKDLSTAADGLSLLEALIDADSQHAINFFSTLKLPKTLTDYKTIIAGLLIKVVQNSTDRSTASLVVTHHLPYWRPVISGAVRPEQQEAGQTVSRSIFQLLLDLQFDLSLALVPPRLWNDLLNHSSRLEDCTILPQFADRFLAVLRSSDQVSSFLSFLVRRPSSPLGDLMVRRLGYMAQRYYMEASRPSLTVLAETCLDGLEEFVNQRYSLGAVANAGLSSSAVAQSSVDWSRAHFTLFIRIFLLPKHYEQLTQDGATPAADFIVFYAAVLRRLHRLCRHFVSSMRLQERLDEYTNFAFSFFNVQCRSHLMSCLAKLSGPYSSPLVQSYFFVVDQLGLLATVPTKQLSDIVVAIDRKDLCVSLLKNVSPFYLSQAAFAHVWSITGFPEFLLWNSDLFDREQHALELSCYRVLDSDFVFKHLEKANKAKLKFSREREDDTRSIVFAAIQHTLKHGKEEELKKVHHQLEHFFSLLASGGIRSDNDGAEDEGMTTMEMDGVDEENGSASEGAPEEPSVVHRCRKISEELRKQERKQRRLSVDKDRFAKVVKHKKICYLIQNTQYAGQILSTFHDVFVVDKDLFLRSIDLPLYIAIRASYKGSRTPEDLLRLSILQILHKEGAFLFDFLGFSIGESFESKASIYIDNIGIIRDDRAHIDANSALAKVLLAPLPDAVTIGVPEVVVRKLERHLPVARHEVVLLLQALHTDENFSRYLSWLRSQVAGTLEDGEGLMANALDYLIVFQNGIARRFCVYLLQLLDEKDSPEFVEAYKYLIYQLNTRIMHPSAEPESNIPVFFSLVHFSRQKVRPCSLQYLLSFLFVDVKSDEYAVLKKNHYMENILLMMQRIDSESKATVLRTLRECSVNSVGAHMMRRATFWFYLYTLCQAEARSMRPHIIELLQYLTADTFGGPVPLVCRTPNPLSDFQSCALLNSVCSSETVVPLRRLLDEFEISYQHIPAFCTSSSAAPTSQSASSTVTEGQSSLESYLSTVTGAKPAKDRTPPE